MLRGGQGSAKDRIRRLGDRCLGAESHGHTWDYVPHHKAEVLFRIGVVLKASLRGRCILHLNIGVVVTSVTLVGHGEASENSLLGSREGTNVPDLAMRTL